MTQGSLRTLLYIRLGAWLKGHLPSKHEVSFSQYQRKKEKKTKNIIKWFYTSDTLGDYQQAFSPYAKPQAKFLKTRVCFSVFPSPPLLALLVYPVYLI
jgi:hypothetical protein